MKIVVIGGSGLVGSKLVTKLREHGREALAASPNSGVNTLTGEGTRRSAERCPGGLPCRGNAWPEARANLRVHTLA